ncbi:MAG: TVP38/TMEM64 family protein [Elusimicrobia bacterium]|nr:TVP38/TMEM64 family protein [Elusimicrobiota bacterium]
MKLPQPKPRRSPSLAREALLILLVVVLLGLGWRLGLKDLLKTLLLDVREMGPWAPLAYIGLYVGACVLMLPGSVVGIAGGLIFGVRRGFLYASTGCVLGAAAAFLVGRHLIRGLVTRKLERYEPFEAIQEAVAAEGWRIVGLTRLSPLMPFSLLNYVFGVSRVSSQGPARPDADAGARRFAR